MNDQYTFENLFIYQYEKSEKNLTKWWEQVEGMVSLRTGGRKVYVWIIFLESQFSHINEQVYILYNCLRIF